MVPLRDIRLKGSSEHLVKHVMPTDSITTSIAQCYHISQRSDGQVSVPEFVNGCSSCKEGTRTNRFTDWLIYGSGFNPKYPQSSTPSHPDTPFPIKRKKEREREREKTGHL